jgi:two-component sensor histidine kinase
MAAIAIPNFGLSDLYITGELDRRVATVADYRQEMLAIQDLAGRMADAPQDVLPRFVDLAMEITGATSGGLSLYEPVPAPGVFRWRYLRGALAPFENATTPRDFSPCGVTLDQNGPVLTLHPERVYSWISDAGIIVPEVLLVPLYLAGTTPLGTLWIVSEREGHFCRQHARAMTELASFVGIALRMLDGEQKLVRALEEQETLTKEMSHRVKNLFTITDGMIRMTARNATDKDEMAKALSGRLHALASAHSLVSRNLREVGRAPRTGDIEALVRAVVLPHCHPGDAPDARFVIEGALVRCGDHAMNGVALVLHELTTNAAKYGALTSEQGRVDVRWHEDGEDMVLTWTESGGPAIAGPPLSDGFGSALVRSTVAGQLGGSLLHDWDVAGLRVTIHLPTAKLAY